MIISAHSFILQALTATIIILTSLASANSQTLSDLDNEGWKSLKLFKFESLLEKINNVNELTASGHTYGYKIVEQKNRTNSIPFLELLLSKGFNINLKNSKNVGASDTGASDAMLHRAALSIEHEEVVKYLLSKGADPNIEGSFASTPLHRAVMFHHPPGLDYLPTVKLLLTAGANLEAKDDAGYTPFLSSLALIGIDLKGKNPMAVELIDLGADVKAVNLSKQNALHIIASHRKDVTKYMRLFIEKGVDPKALDITGKSPLQRAGEYSNDANVNFLKGVYK